MHTICPLMVTFKKQWPFNQHCLPSLLAVAINWGVILFGSFFSSNLYILFIVHMNFVEDKTLFLLRRWTSDQIYPFLLASSSWSWLSALKLFFFLGVFFWLSLWVHWTPWKEKELNFIIWFNLVRIKYDKLVLIRWDHMINKLLSSGNSLTNILLQFKGWKNKKSLYSSRVLLC